MARVDVIKKRIQASHFGLYRTSTGGDESIIVRRKVGEPTDYMHTKSRKLARQRANLTVASQHYSHLTPSQKAITRHQIEEVEYQQSHGKTDTKLLLGRQLFISKEMHSLETAGKQLVLPYQLCIMLVDELLLPLEGELWLRYLKDAEWLDVASEELATGSWLFSQVPRGQEAYRPYGEAENYYDPELPEHQFMTESQLLAYRYHILLSTLEKICHALPTGITATDTCKGTKMTQPFRPCNDFDLKEMLFSLRHHQTEYAHPPTSGFISIHEADGYRKPIEPPLRKTSFTISVPSYPEWQPHKVAFTPLALEADKLYIWVIGFPGKVDTWCRLHIEKGEAGDCNLDPITPTYISLWKDGYWQDWQLFAMPQFYYEMKA